MPGNRNVQLEEVEEQSPYHTVEKRLKQKKKRIRNYRLKVWLHRLFVLCLIIAIGIGIYFFDRSSYSRVQVVSVSGTTVYTAEEIQELTGIKVNSRRLLTIPIWIEYQMKGVVGIASVSVNNHVIDGVVTVNVQEERAIAYEKTADGLRVYYGSGDSVIIPDERESSLIDVPLISGFTDSQVIERIMDSLDQLSDDVLLSISQIKRVSLYSDENMIYFYMDDGHILISSQFGISALKDYSEMLSNDKTDKKCWVVLDMNESNQIVVLPTDCP